MLTFCRGMFCRCLRQQRTVVPYHGLTTRTIMVRAWSNFLYPRKDRDAFESFTKKYNGIPSSTVFGNGLEFQINDIKITAMLGKILIGNFDRTLLAVPVYDLGRSGVVKLKEELLNGLLPNTPDGQIFASQYYSLNPVDKRVHSWPALGNPEVISNMVKFSKAVIGSQILQNHSGLVLAYVFSVIKEQKQFDDDLNNGVAAYKPIAEYGNDEKYTLSK